MINVAVIQELYRYNRWASGRMFEAVSNLAPEEFANDLGSSFPSIRDTLLHIIWAEWIWLQRWKGLSPQSVLQVTSFADLGALKTRGEPDRVRDGVDKG